MIKLVKKPDIYGYAEQIVFSWEGIMIEPKVALNRVKVMGYDT